MGLRPKNKDHANFYECCDLTKKVCLIVHTAMIIFGFEKKKFFVPRAFTGPGFSDLHNV